ncbi:MAG: DUF3179 domain-containing (seleno)protein [Chloroflexota bacterium]
MTDFDESRAILLDEPEPDAYMVTEYMSLAVALQTSHLAPHSHCLIATYNDTVLVMPTIALVYHHVAQDKLDDLNWLVTFCALCNAGSFYDATLKGEVIRFAAQGYYDTMTLIADKDTQSYWDHLTGTCISGEREGEKLTHLSPLLQMTAEEAQHAYPDALFAHMHLSDDVEATGKQWNDHYRMPEEPDHGGLAQTSGEEDSRLPRYDMGLGIWTKDTHRYYSAHDIYTAHSVILDTLEGRTIVVCMDEMIGLPTVFYCETENAVMAFGEVRLDNNQVYKQGVLYKDSTPMKAERPTHNAIRWYGFSSLFPGCEIYGR